MPQGTKSLDAINLLVGQAITVAAGLLAFSVTFISAYTVKDHLPVVPCAMKLAWGGLVLSMFFGFYTLFAVAGTLDEIDRTNDETNKARWNIKIPSLLLIIAFLVSMGSMAVGGIQLAS